MVRDIFSPFLSFENVQPKLVVRIILVISTVLTTESKDSMPLGVLTIVAWLGCLLSSVWKLTQLK